MLNYTLLNDRLRAAKENLFVFLSLNESFIFVLGTAARRAARTVSYHNSHHSLKSVLDFIFCSRNCYSIVILSILNKPKARFPVV